MKIDQQAAHFEFTGLERGLMRAEQRPLADAESVLVHLEAQRAYFRDLQLGLPSHDKALFVIGRMILEIEPFLDTSAIVRGCEELLLQYPPDAPTS